MEKRFPIILSIGFISALTLIVFTFTYKETSKKSADYTIRLNTPTTLSIGEEGVFEDKNRLRFDGISEDSRCPVNVFCIREGNVVARFSLRDSTGAVLTTLNITRNQTRKINGDYTIKLLDVKPYPVSGEKINENEYQSTIILSR